MKKLRAKKIKCCAIAMRLEAAIIKCVKSISSVNGVDKTYNAHDIETRIDVRLKTVKMVVY